MQGQGRPSRLKINDRYGMLVVLKIWHEKVPNRQSLRFMCECKCDCGKIIEIWADNLRYTKRKQTLSCGCIAPIHGANHPLWKGYGEISRAHLTQIKNNSIRRNRILEFNITIEQLWELFLKQGRRCAISGEEIQFATHRKNNHGSCTASLDRIDSSKGYTIDNVQWVHRVVQNMKQSMDDKLFIEWCRVIANNNPS